MAPESTNKNSELIGKLIQKRKEENEAFKKLLSAIEELGEQQPDVAEPPKSPSKQKVSKRNFTSQQ